VRDDAVPSLLDDAVEQLGLRLKLNEGTAGAGRG